MKQLNQILCRLAVLVSMALFLCLLAGCGAAGQQLGVDGFVYVPALVCETMPKAAPPSDFSVADGWLYYLYDSRTLKRTSLNEMEEKQNFVPEEGETVLSVGSALSAVPQAELSAGKFSSAWIADYAVDAQGGIFYVAFLSRQSGFDTVPAGAILCRQSPEGILSYWREIPGIYDDPGLTRIPDASDSLVPDGKGGVYVLGSGAVLLLDAEGRTQWSLPIEEDIRPSVNPERKGCLLKGGRGRIYYVMEDMMHLSRQTFAIDRAGEPGMTQAASALSGHMVKELYAGLDGLLVQDEETETLYRYDDERGALSAMLKWGDSNLVAGDIWELVQLGQDRCLAVRMNDDDSTSVLLLTKTPVRQLPKKEHIVIASLLPSRELKRSAAAFNLANDKYHVSIESYGASVFGGANEDARARLDAAIVSGHPPDLLDLAGLDFSKYARNGMLEDLTPYMEGDGTISRENYLGNVLEGYTVDGRLACIPKSFYFRAVFGIAEPSRALAGGWTMPALMGLTEQNPDASLFGDAWRSDTYLLEEFCAPYYLERFVDWERGGCSFDSEEFRRLLQWAKDWNVTRGDSAGALLGITYINMFVDYPQFIFRYPDGIVNLGMPSADGRGVLKANVADALGMTAASMQKEGAWEFLRYFLAPDITGPASILSLFPTRRDQLDALALEAVTPMYVLDENGNPVLDAQGKEMVQPKLFWHDDSGTLHAETALKQEDADAVMRLIESVDFTPRSRAEQGIVDIVLEEAGAYFAGDRSLEDVTRFIQNRAQLLLDEQKK